MKPAILGTLIILLFAALSARATLILSENFTYTNGNLTAVSGGKWTAASGGGTLPIQVNGATISFTNVPSGGSGEDLKRDFGNYTNGVLYMSALVAMSNAPTANNGDYFLAFNGTGGFSTRIFACATTGGWTFGMTNSGSAPVKWTSALSTATWYKLVAKLDFDSGKIASFGVFDPTYVPASDTELTVTSGPATQTSVTSVLVRQGSVAGTAWKGALDYILVGDTLADVASRAPVAPAITTQPQDAAGFVGSTVSFSAVAVGESGDAPLYYQWYYNTNNLLVESSAVIGTTSNVLTLTNLNLGQNGYTYSCVVSNNGGTNVTRYAVLSVSPAPIPPTIDTDLGAGSTNIVGDTVVFRVAAHGLPVPAYQWQFIADTNTAVTNLLSGPGIVSDASGSTLTLTSVTTNLSGKYFVTITNSTAYYATNSAEVVLKVNPSPFLNISTVRAMVNGSFAPTNTTSMLTVQGIVTTWVDMTGVANTLFYMQDSTAGIAVFWANADGTTNLPPAGALVRVTGSLTSFNGLLELRADFTNSLTSVTIISTGNPLPAPQALPFDPNVTTAQLKAMEGSYFVASNVTLTAGATFVSGSNEAITNNANRVLTDSMFGLTFTNASGQTFTMFVNAQTDIKGQPKPTGPVTIFGILGYFSFVGFEFTPSRYADIIAYNHVTNIVSNVRQGDLGTNSFTENVVRQAGSITSYFSLGDPDGGSVSLTPVTDGLPGTAHWRNVVNGDAGNPATAQFSFQPAPADAGSNYVVALVETTATAVTTNHWNVYVPTPEEEQIYITEVFAKPTTTASSPAFNPLHRAEDTNNVAVNDRYVEVGNLSGTDQDLFKWTVGDASTTWHQFYSGGPGETLSSSNAIVIYGGPLNNDANPPQLPVLNFPASASLGLSANGGMVTLRNKSGYLVDRVLYPASTVDGSFSRFPTLNGALVPQAFVSTNFVTAGAQYDGGAWNLATKVPTGVTGVGISYGNPVTLRFTADTTKASTLWVANKLADMFQVVTGRQFPTSSGGFTITNPPAAMQFYFITTQ